MGRTHACLFMSMTSGFFWHREQQHNTWLSAVVSSVFSGLFRCNFISRQRRSHGRWEFPPVDLNLAGVQRPLVQLHTSLHNNNCSLPQCDAQSQLISHLCIFIGTSAMKGKTLSVLGAFPETSKTKWSYYKTEITLASGLWWCPQPVAGLYGTCEMFRAKNP